MGTNEVVDEPDDVGVAFIYLLHYGDLGLNEFPYLLALDFAFGDDLYRNSDIIFFVECFPDLCEGARADYLEHVEVFDL